MEQKKNVPAEDPKTTEDQQWKGFSVFLHVLLPIAGMALLWGQRGFFSKLLLQLDRSCVAVYCPSLSKREKLLKWASGRLPSTWSSQARTLSSGIPELWKDGSLLCTLINSVVPGACPNPHRHWRKPPLHAQALAYKYLGLAPMFTEDELSGELTINQERNFIHYLYKLQEAINKWPAKDELNRKFSSQYVARGMGLYTAEQSRKTVFYIYANTKTKIRSNVLMYMRGPYGTHGKAIISPFHNLKTIPVVHVLQDQLEATGTLPFKNDDQKSFLKTISLDFTSLINGIEDNKDKNEIPIQIDMELDRAKITYIPQNSGMYEINLICDGELLRGSPYNVQVTKNTSNKKDTFNTENENVEEKITFTKRKILSKVIDCIDEKICIDNDNTFKIGCSRSSENSTESENDDLTITAITKRKDEILKTEISCSLEGIIEEIDKDKGNALNEIKNIAEELKNEVPKIIDVDETDAAAYLINTKHKLVKDTTQAREEIISIFEKKNVDEVDNATETQESVNKTPAVDLSLIESTKYIMENKHELLKKILPTEILEPKEASQDENNNLRKTPVKRIKSKVHLEILPKNIPKTTTNPDPTSPICPDHIAPEVESSLNQLSLSEKRKTFSKQDSFSIPDSTFSESESNKDSSSKEMSVLNVLDSLKRSRRASLSESEISLTSAVSLPNITTHEENTYKSRRDYWERLSSRSSSNASLANSDHSQKFNIKKNYFSKYKTEKKEEIPETTKSTGELSLSKNKSIEEVRVYNDTTDTSLEDCTIIPLEERKKILLKNMYKQETRQPKKLNMKITLFKKNDKPKKDEKLKYFSPIVDRIQSFDKNTRTASSSTDNNEVDDKPEPKGSSTKKMLKTQFKKAVRFFKNLEESAKMKQNDIKRRYSLDHQKKNKYRIRSGSLNLPHISDRFSINNLYEDVSSRNGSFRGPPNKTGIINSLSSFPRNEENGENQDENEISYNLFKNKFKSKKRKSIKSIFDVNY